MALEWYLSLEGVEIANHARLQAYLDSIGSPLDTGSAVCACPTFTAESVGDDPYATPAEDDAPWYDPDVPESADFAGLLVLSVEGLDDHPVTRSVTTAVAGGAALGPARTQPRTLVVTAVLLGVTCCAVDYGLRWLAQALTGCTGAGCDGDCLTVYSCCPPQDMPAEEFAARHRRTLRRVALVDGPRVIQRNGDGCATGGCQAGADILTVEFTLTAATPWLWADPVPVAELAIPTDDDTGCVDWCVHTRPVVPPVCIDLDAGPCPPDAVAVQWADQACDEGWPDETEVERCEPCRFAPCPDPDALCADTSCRIPTPPQPPPPATCFCSALAVNTTAVDLDLSDWPRWAGAAPMIEVYAGSADLRRVTITLYERTREHDGLTCEEVAERERCNPHSVYEISYVPAGGTVTLDGQVGRAMVSCGGRCERSPDVYGRDGGPIVWPLLDCAAYCLVVEADATLPVADDATVLVSLSTRY